MTKVIRRTASVIIISTALLIFGSYMVKYFNPAIGKGPSQEEVSRAQQHNGQKFINTIDTQAGGFGSLPKIIKTYLTRKVESSPISSYNFDISNESVLNDSTVQINWLGHAAVMLHYQDKYVLLDPMLSERASPFRFMGPKRYHDSPVDIETLHEIETVVISHDHYDHLDYQSIRSLDTKVKQYLVPIGIGATLVHWGVDKSKIIEMDWWEETTVGEFKFTATPARHFSGRYFSRDNTLWASWAIEVGDSKIYFGGDSGIFDGFQEIGDRMGPFDLSLMPIGAYNELWHDIHLDPEEAANAFEMVNGGTFLPIHWGTFDLAPHSWYDPIERIVKQSQERDFDLVTPKPGEWIEINQLETDHYWWVEYSEVATRPDKVKS